MFDSESTYAPTRPGKIHPDEFDSFILNNFNPFSGSENVTDWLNNTDKKFKSHKISRNLRSIAVPLLVEGDAKAKYILNRNTIKSYDDLYEFLLINYARPILLSTAIVDMGATGPTGDEPEIVSTITPPQFPLTSITSPNLTLSIPPTLNQRPSDTNNSNDTDKNSLRFSHESSSSSSLFRRNVSSYPHYHAGQSFSQSNSNKQRSNSNQNYNTSANQPRSRFSYNKNNRQHHANSIVTTNILILFDSKPPSLFSK